MTSEASVPSWVRPGVKVVCVTVLNQLPYKNGEVFPVKGSIYTIRNIHHSIRNGFGIRLEEIVNKPVLYTNSFSPVELAFGIKEFKPLVEQKGMETLRAILKNPSDKIKGFEQKKVKRKEHV